MPVFSTCSFKQVKEQQQHPFKNFNKAQDDGGLRSQWHGPGHVQIVFPSLLTENHADNSTLNFYGQVALRDAKLTTSKL